MNNLNYDVYGPYDHHQAEAEITNWANEYKQAKAEGEPLETLESYLNDMIAETQK